MLHSTLEIKAIKVLEDTPNGSFEGYGNVTNFVDSVNEMSVTGAFVEGIQEFLINGWIALNHEWCDLPIAMPVDAKEDGQGLYFKAEFHSTSEAQDARTVMRERAAKGKSVRFSIGYDVLVDEYDSETGVRLLKKIKVYEISYVNLPANELSILTGIKSGTTYSEEHSTALAVVTDFANRSKELLELRTKDGRVLSAANREKLMTLKTALSDALAVIDEVIILSEPKPKPDEMLSTSIVEMAKLQMQFLKSKLQRINQ